MGNFNCNAYSIWCRNSENVEKMVALLWVKQMLKGVTFRFNLLTTLNHYFISLQFISFALACANRSVFLRSEHSLILCYIFIIIYFVFRVQILVSSLSISLLRTYLMHSKSNCFISIRWIALNGCVASFLLQSLDCYMHGIWLSVYACVASQKSKLAHSVTMDGHYKLLSSMMCCFFYFRNDTGN